MNQLGLKEIIGTFEAERGHWGLIVSRFNSLITERLLEGAVDALKRHGALAEAMELVRVPGAFEIPWAARELASTGRFDGIVCLGAVIRGDTPHFDMVANETAKGIAAVSLETGVPVGFGVLTTDTLEQALERAGTKAGNKGFDAAMTVIEMVRLKEAISSSAKMD